MADANLDSPAGEVVPAAGVVVGLSAWHLSGRQRRPPAGVRTLGRSSSSASNIAASGVLAAVTSSDSGSPMPSAARCSLDPRLARSTGFAPVRSPPHRPEVERVHADARPVELASPAELVQQQLLEPLENPGVGPIGKPPPAGRHAAAAELAHRSSAQGVEVRAMTMIAAMQARSDTQASEAGLILNQRVSLVSNSPVPAAATRAGWGRARIMVDLRAGAHPGRTAPLPGRARSWRARRSAWFPGTPPAARLGHRRSRR